MLINNELPLPSPKPKNNCNKHLKIKKKCNFAVLYLQILFNGLRKV